MSNQVKLVVNGNVVDTSDNFNIKLQREVKDANDIESRRGDFSYTFELPMTASNNELFNFTNDIQLKDRYYKRFNYTAKVLVNETEIIEGNLRFPKFNYSKKTYSTNLISNSIDWASGLKERSLQQLETLGDESVGSVSMYESVTAYTASTALHSDSQVLVFPLVAYGQYFVPFNELYKNIIDGTPQLGETLDQRPQVTYLDIPPSFYLHKVIRAMFKDVGFTVAGSWINSDFTKSLVMPYTGDKPAVIYGFSNLIGAAKGTAPTVNFIDESNRTSFSAYTTVLGFPINEFVTKLDYSGTYNLSFTGFTGGFLHSAFATRNGNTIAGSLAAANIAIVSSITVDLNSGDVIRIAQNILGTREADSNLSVKLQRIGGATNLALALPDVNQSDFLKSIIKLFNLYFLVDERNKVIYFEPWNTFYQDRFNAIDITNKVDVNSIVIEQIETPLSYQFKWEEDSSDFLLTNSVTNYNYTHTTVNPTSSDKEITVLFAPTVNETYYLSTNIGTYTNPEYDLSASTLIQIPVLANEDAIKSVQTGLDYVEWEYDYTPRLLKLDGFYEFTGSTKFPFRSGSEIKYVDKWPKATFPDSLNWSNLFDEFYENEIRELERSELLTCDVLLSYQDYINLTPNRLIKIKQNYYRLIKIEGFTPTKNELTKMVMQRVIY